MKFYDFIDGYTLLPREVKKSIDRETFYASIARKGMIANDIFAFRQACLEQDWNKNQRPYYNVWPLITPMFEKLRLSIPCSVVKMDIPALCLRLPEQNNPLEDGTAKIRCILFGIQPTSKDVGNPERVPGLVVMLDTGEVHHGLPMHTFKVFPLREDKTIEEAMALLKRDTSSDWGLKISQELVDKAIRLCVCVTLIGNNPDFLTPDVLADDRDKYERGNEEQKRIIVERAHRRGKIGYDLGKKLEISPHLRHSHPALYWTGEGRKIPQIIIRKETIVKRKKATDVPTSHYGSDQ